MIEYFELFLGNYSGKGPEKTASDRGAGPSGEPYPRVSAPGAYRQNLRGEERSTDGRALRFVHEVGCPQATVYFAPEPCGTFVILCPGGGYRGLSIDKEGHDFSRLLAGWGISSMVLYSRLPSAPYPDPPVSLLDVWAAFDAVTENAAAWKVDPAKIGYLGFSAGGHLAGLAVMKKRNADKTPPATGLAPEQPAGQAFLRQARPAFLALAYPVVSFKEGLAHQGSRDRLLGPAASSETVEAFSLENLVGPSVPPCFIVHSDDDQSVPVGNSLILSEALAKNGVDYELLRHPSGGHGYGFGPAHGFPTAPDWTPRLRTWLKRHRFVEN